VFSRLPKIKLPMIFRPFATKNVREKAENRGNIMLMTASTVLLDDIAEQTARLKAEILSSRYESDGERVAYYISPDGNDNADGRTPETAWRSVKALSVHTPEPDSEVLFERGGVYRGTFRTAVGVTYAAFGDGEKPRIYGSPYDGAKDGDWTEVAPSVWRYSEKMTGDCGGIVFDGGETHARKAVVNYENEPIENVSREPFRDYRDLQEDLQFWHDLGGAVVSNPDGGYLYLCSKEGNPAERFGEIEFLVRGNIIGVGGERTTIEDLCIMYGGSHGIGSGTTRELTVRNCVIGWIGGSLQFYRNGKPTRFGNGVEIYGGCDRYTIDHCWVYQIYDAGITHQLSTGGDRECIMRHVRYTENLIEYCSYNIEYFLGHADSEDTVRYMDDIVMRGNILRYAGYGWGNQRPDRTSPAHIKGWDSRNKATNFIIEDNIAVYSRYMMVHCGAEKAEWLPHLIDNTFVQNDGGDWGRFDVSPTRLMPYSRDSLTADEYDSNEFFVLPKD